MHDLPPLYILVLDDHQLFSEGLASLLKSHLQQYEIVLVHTLKETEQSLRNSTPALILLDLNLQNENGLNLLRYLKPQDFPPPCLVISSEIDIQVIAACLALNAAGFVHKSSSTEVLVEAVETVLNSGFYLSKEIKKQLDQLSQNYKPYRNEYNLTEQEVSILGHLQTGIANKAIAEIMCISQHTVKYHLANIYKKLNVKNRTECINVASSLGLIS